MGLDYFEREREEDEYMCATHMEKRDELILNRE